MIDINNSQQYDDDTYKAVLAEEIGRASGGLLLNPLSGFYQEMFAESGVGERAKRELTDPIQFMKQAYPHQRVSRFILTHPDLDHMRGLRRLYDTVGFDTFWDTANIKPNPSFRSDQDRVDWEFYQQLRGAGLATYCTRGYPYENLLTGGDGFEVLGPTREVLTCCNLTDSYNDVSIVLRLRHAGRTVLFPGDAESMAWDALIRLEGIGLKSDFLKASHHGRDTGYHMETVRLIKPQMTFVSVGQKPATDASSKYRGFSNRVASTRFYGNMELRIGDGGVWEWFVQRNAGR